MRYVAMQVLTWGTIAGAIGSALLLTALERSPAHYITASPLDAALPRYGTPAQAGRRPQDRAQPARPAAQPAASAARIAGR